MRTKHYAVWLKFTRLTAPYVASIMRFKGTPAPTSHTGKTSLQARRSALEFAFNDNQ